LPQIKWPPRKDGQLRQVLWCLMQLAVFAGVVYWGATDPDLKNGSGQNVGALMLFALLMTMAATAAVMITRDACLWIGRLVSRAVSPRHAGQADDGPKRIDAGPGASEPRKLTSRLRVGKQPRKLIDVVPHSPPLDRL
jgi:hypothetical protein